LRSNSEIELAVRRKRAISRTLVSTIPDLFTGSEPALEKARRHGCTARLELS
jgi:hypothetical protein